MRVPMDARMSACVTASPFDPKQTSSGAEALLDFSALTELQAIFKRRPTRLLRLTHDF